MDLEEFEAEVKQRLLAEMQAIRDPGGDVRPTFFHYFEGDDAAVRRMPLPGEMFANEDNRRRGFHALGMATAAITPTYLACVVTAYYAEYDFRKLSPDERRAAIEDNDMPASIIQPKDHPERREVVQLLLFSKDKSSGQWSFIERDGRNPPAFGEWKPMPFEPDGMIVRPLKNAMRGSR